VKVSLPSRLQRSRVNSSLMQSTGICTCGTATHGSLSRLPAARSSLLEPTTHQQILLHQSRLQAKPQD
jgi:hypothetical protein